MLMYETLCTCLHANLEALCSTLDFSAFPPEHKSNQCQCGQSPSCAFLKIKPNKNQNCKYYFLYISYTERNIFGLRLLQNMTFKAVYESKYIPVVYSKMYNTCNL